MNLMNFSIVIPGWIIAWIVSVGPVMLFLITLSLPERRCGIWKELGEVLFDGLLSYQGFYYEILAHAVLLAAAPIWVTMGSVAMEGSSIFLLTLWIRRENRKGNEKALSLNPHG